MLWQTPFDLGTNVSKKILGRRLGATGLSERGRAETGKHGGDASVTPLAAERLKYQRSVDLSDRIRRRRNERVGVALEGALTPNLRKPAAPGA